MKQLVNNSHMHTFLEPFMSLKVLLIHTNSEYSLIHGALCIHLSSFISSSEGLVELSP